MKQNKGLFLIFLTAIISGFSVFINKLGVSVVNPYIFTGLKNIVVAFLITGSILLARQWLIFKKISGKQWLLFVLVGFVGGSVPFLLFFKGLSMTSGVQAGFIHKTLFVFVFILAALFLKEKISKNILIIGLILFLANILLLNSLPHSFKIGDLLILSATLLWAVENVLSKHLLGSLPAKIVIWSRMFFGSLFIILFWLATNQVHLILNLNLEQIGWTMITAVFLLGYVSTWYAGLKYVKVSTACVVLLVSAPITYLLSVVFLNQSLEIAPIAGIILTAGALGLMLNKYRTAVVLTN